MAPSHDLKTAAWLRWKNWTLAHHKASGISALHLEALQELAGVIVAKPEGDLDKLFGVLESLPPAKTGPAAQAILGGTPLEWVVAYYVEG